MDQNEAEQLKQISNHYVDKRKEIMNSTKIKVEDISGDVIRSSLSAFLTSMAILITFEYIRGLKLRYTKLRDWIIFITIFYEKTLRESMVLKKWIKTKPSNWNRFLITTLINEKKLWIQLKSK